MIKRLLSLILAFSLLVSACPVYAAAETTEETTPAAVEIVPETTEAVVETEAQTEPEETVIETEPEEPAVETEPEETVVETEPEETVVETEPEETVVETEPEETVIETEPEETVVETEPEETVVETEPEVVVTEPEAEETAYETFVVGETKNVTMADGETLVYSITVEESGVYTVYESGQKDLYWRLMAEYSSEEEGEWTEEIDSDWCGLRLNLTAGREYLLYAENYSGEENTFTLNFIEAVEPDSLRFDTEQCVGVVDGRNSVYFDKTPWYSHKAPEITSSDESVAKVTSISMNDTYGYVHFTVMGEGSATITATLSDGTTDSFTVIGVGRTALTAGEPATVEMEDGVYAYFSFTPEVSGYYTFWETHDNENLDDLYMSLTYEEVTEEESYTDTVSGNGKLCVYLSAGAKVELETVAYADTSMTMTVTESAAVESFTLSKTAMTVQEGEYFNLSWEFAPVNAKQESITWTSSDETIVWRSWSSQNRAYFYAGDVAGTATLTATTESGLTAQCVITVETMPEITLGNTVAGTLDAGTDEETSFTYAFTAPATATYALVGAEGTESYWEIRAEAGSWLDSGWVYENKALIFSCEEGVRYLLEVRNWQSDSVYYAVDLLEAVAPETIAFEQPTRTGFVGLPIDLYFEYSPAIADLSQVQWSVDSDCAAINRTENHYVNVQLNKTGTAVVTATLPNGNTASCTITIQEPVGELVIGTPMELDVGNNAQTAVTFTAPATTSYKFWNSTGENCYIEVRSSEGYGYGSGDPCQAYLQAGDTYLVILNNYSSTKPVLNVAECVDAEGIAIEYTEYAGFEGQYVYMDLIWEPINALREDAEWTSSDPDVATVSGSGWGGAVNLLTEGTTIITATTNSGKTATCIVTVKPSIVLEVGSREEVTLGRDEFAAYQFTAPADGTYVLWNESESYLSMDVQNKTTGEYIYGNSRFVLKAAAGDVFSILCQNYQNGVRTFVLNLDEGVEATGISLSRESCIGFTDDYISVDLEVLPANAVSNVTWTSSDATVAEIRYADDQYATIGLLKEGVATITATTENGLSDSFTVTVKEPEVISAPYSAVMTIPSNGFQNFLFTPTESAYYAFWNDNNYYTNIEVQELNGDWIGGRENQILFYGRAGQTYLIRANCYSDRALTYSLHLDKCTDLQSVTLSRSEIRGLVGNMEYISLTVNPGNAYYQNVTWTVADTSIAEIPYSGDGYANINLKKAGTTTITANVDGVTATATITVMEPIVIEAPYSASHTMEAGEAIAFRFTAPKTGTYVFWDAAEPKHYPQILVRNPNGNGFGTNTRVQFDAVEGTTYDITVENIQSFTTTVELKLQEAVEPTEVKFAASEHTSWVGMNYYLEVSMDPINANLNGLEWTVDNEDVAEIDYLSPTGGSVYLKKAGTVTVTMTCGDLTDTCTITVKQPETITAGQEKTVAVDGWTNVMFQFTPAESGTYVIWEGNYELSNFEVFYSDGMYLDWGRSRLQFYATAGQTYSFFLYNPYEDNMTFAVNVDKAAPLTSLSLGDGVLNATVGQGWWLIPECEPANADLSGIFWSVDNEDVVKIEDPYSNAALLFMVGEGTATVTATVGDTTVTRKVVVSDAEPEAPVIKATNDTATGKPKLTWDAVEGAAKYKVYRSTSKTGKYSLMSTVTGTSYINKSAKTGTTYYYYVVAVSAGDAVSEKSNIVSRICDLASPVITVTNVDSTGKLKITWEAVADAVEYQIWRSTSKTGTYTNIKTTTSTSFTNTSVTAGTTYYYKVKAIAEKTSANSVYSVIESGVGKLAQPAITLSSVASTGKIKVSWKTIDDAVSYDVYRSTTKDGTYTKLGNTKTLSYTDKTAEAEQVYYYKVMAIAAKTAGNSAYSAAKYRTCDLARPVVTLSNVASSGKIQLSWEAIDGAVKYQVYRSTSSSGTYSKIAETESVTYTDTSAAAGKTYYYKVRAVASNSGANSAYSSVKSLTCDLARPVVTLSNVASSGKIKISWKAVTGAVKYEVYRATSKTGTYTRIKTTTSTSFTNTGAVAGKTYYYKVRAICSDTDGNSAYSTIKSRTCDLAQPNVTVKLNSNGKPRLSWSAIDGAVKYEIYRSTSKTGTYTLVKTTTSCNWANTGAKSGTTYYYKVRAIATNSGANSAYSAIDSITTK